MALPLPKVIADVGPGGPLVTAMGGVNALHNARMLAKMNEIKAQYAPLTTQADAASKLAYANLMGPQFLAKIMGNNSALGNLTEDQKKTALEKIYQAGSGQGTGANIFGQMQGGAFGAPDNSLSGWLVNKLKGALGHNQPSNALSNPMTQFSQPAPMTQPPGVGAPVPTQEQQPTDDESAPVNAEDLVPGKDYDNKEIHDAFKAWLQTPQGKEAIAAGGGNMPDTKKVVDWDRARKTQNPIPAPQVERPKTFGENAGEYTGVLNEGGESGKIRAKQREELDNTVFNGETAATTLNEISDIISSPEFEQIRQVPLAGHHEIAYYEKEGTAEQQQMATRYKTLTGNLIKDASRDFAGQFRKGEQQLLNGMKPNPGDTVDGAKGKTEALSVLNKMLTQRARLTSKYMEKNHSSKLEASEWADRQVNGNKIRQEVHDRLNPTVTIYNSKTKQKRTVSVSEARKLGVPNV